MTDLINRVAGFFLALFHSVVEALNFIGGPFEMFRAAVDVGFLTIVFYFIILLVRDSRAWQLLKGILLILVIGLTSNLLGLTSLGYLVSKTVSIFTIAFVVLFQPELRRALETVGRSRLMRVVNDEQYYDGREQRLIESIVEACGQMAKTRTGALIVIERTTPLGDLQEQENAVPIDAAVSTTMLKQIFYVGSPLHDGAVLIRNGRLAAARVHIPLSDNYHLRKDLGTRHRAAIGASEIGDTIAIVCSEERGTISICIEGRLYPLNDEDALRMQLHRLLQAEPEASSRKKHLPFHVRAEGIRMNVTAHQRIGSFIAALIIALGFWIYVQMTVNPVETEIYEVPLSYQNQSDLEAKGLEAQYRLETVRMTVTGRRQTLEGLRARDLMATVDLGKVEKEGLSELPVKATAKNGVPVRADKLSPATVLINVRQGESVPSQDTAEGKGN